MLALVAAPDRDEKVEIRQVDEPAPGPTELVMQVRSISLNRGEVNRLASAADGWRPGWDVAGTVLRAAADGSGPAEGTRILGLSYFGGWCQRLAVPTLQVAIIPEPVSFQLAATLPVAGLTALRLLRFGGLLLDRRVLITGASGGVGRLALQLADQSGAAVTAVVGSPDRASGLRELGADEVVQGIESATGQFDLVLEAAGGSSLAASLKLVAEGGTVVVYGNSSKEPTTFMVNDFYFKGARLSSFYLFGSMAGEPVARDLSHLLNLVAAGHLDPQLSLECSWHEAARA
ncbi:MAG: zinc-binding dehydrogenase, partial [Candidatus Dormibacteraeota bacterium]|nr:zinc-binding dehydrogenase [Candidatus Dormibacteraeota bacterium]